MYGPVAGSHLNDDAAVPIKHGKLRRRRSQRFHGVERQVKRQAVYILVFISPAAVDEHVMHSHPMARWTRRASPPHPSTVADDLTPMPHSSRLGGPQSRHQ